MDNYCGTCNHRLYTPISRRGELVFQQTVFRHPDKSSLVVEYHPGDGTYWLAESSGTISPVRMYHCHVCGRRLF